MRAPSFAAILALLSAAFPGAMVAQETVLEGRVVDAVTGEVVGNADVRPTAVPEGGEWRTHTADDGSFTIAGLAAGRYSARVERLGYVGRPCIPAMFVDGVPYVMTTRGLDDFTPSGIEAIEVYTGSSRIPAQLNTTGRDHPRNRSDQVVGSPRCGVIVLWTPRDEG